jgi:hypothetical protein
MHMDSPALWRTSVRRSKGNGGLTTFLVSIWPGTQSITDGPNTLRSTYTSCGRRWPLASFVFFKLERPTIRRHLHEGATDGVVSGFQEQSLRRRHQLRLGVLELPWTLVPPESRTTHSAPVLHDALRPRLHTPRTRRARSLTFRGCPAM